MGALLILVLFIAYLVISIWVIAKVKPRWGKWVALLIAVLIPTADAVYGRMKLKTLCATEGGMKIFRTVEGVEGFYSPFAGEMLLTKSRFIFLETYDGANRYRRISKLPNGGTTTEKDVPLKSEFAYEALPGNLSETYMREIFQVINRKTHEVIGRTTNILYAGGWVERRIAGLYGQRARAGSCHLDHPEVLHDQLISNVLNPKN